MALSAFDDKSCRPDEAERREVLGAAWKAWSGPIEAASAEIGALGQVWGFASRSMAGGCDSCAGSASSST